MRRMRQTVLLVAVRCGIRLSSQAPGAPPTIFDDARSIVGDGATVECRALAATFTGGGQ
jgi:hypothetical protein